MLSRLFSEELRARFLRERGAQAALAIFVVFALSAALSPWIAPQNPYDPCK